jgi:glycosyltransferase involved in cell wall biosynthesis
MESNRDKFVSNFQAEIIEDFSELPKNPLLTIRCSTYNHEEFITKAINGFLMQKTDFPFEILIHDDASTDGTAQIVRTYQARHPNLIRVILQSENQFSQGKRPRQLLHALSRGKYIALCEGDDYWIDPLKLQKQVNFLEMHPECSICCHKVMKYSECKKSNFGTFPPIDEDRIFTRYDFYKQNMMHTCTLLFKNLPMNDYLKKISNVKIGDWALQAYLVQHGDIGYINEVMSVYRFHAGGIWNATDPIINRIRKAETIEIVQKALNLEHEILINQRLLNYYIQFVNHFYRIKDQTNTKQYLRKCFEHKRNFSLLKFRKIFPAILFAYFPIIHKSIKYFR